VRLAAAALLLVAGLAGAGCGSDDADDEGDGATTTVTVAAADRDFCEAFGTIIAGPLADEDTDVREPTSLQAAVQVTQQVLAATVESAPPELADAARQFADEYESGLAIWERYGYDLVRVEAEATPEERAVLDAFLAPPQGPAAADPLTVLEDGYFDRCTAGVTLPEGVVPSTSTSTTATTP
jgi:hypothetical protein